MAKKPKRIWDNYRVIGSVQKSDRIKYVLAAAARDGVKYINIREFYFKQKTQEWKPGLDGITIPIVAPIQKGTKFISPYKGLIEMLPKIAEYLSTMPIQDPEHEVWYYPKEEADEPKGN